MNPGSVNPAAVIFDMDGTLLDNMSLHVETWIALLRDNGMEITAADYYASGFGGTAEEAVRHFLGQHLTDAEASVLADQKEFLYRYLLRSRLKPLPGLRRFLQALQQAGVPMAVATSAGSRNIEFVLEGMKVRSFFGVVVGAHNVVQGKPHPDLFLLAAESLGVPPEQCLVFEDSYPGFEAARRAGMRVVAVTTTHPREELLGVPGVVTVIADYKGLSPQALYVSDATARS